MSQSARLQYIIRCLDHADGVTLREIAEHFEISTRQACRDIEYLRDQMGAPIAYDHRTRRYRLTTLWESYSNVDERLIITGAYLKAVFAKIRLGKYFEDELIASLYNGISDDVRRVLDRIEYRSQSIEVPDWNVLSTLIDAFARNLCVDMVYRNLSGEESRRRIEPGKLVNYGTSWYVVAYDHRRQTTRTFHLSRIVSIVLSKEPMSHAIEVSDKGYGIYLSGPLVPYTIRFTGNAARIVSTQTWSEDQKLVWQDDGSLLLTVSSASVDELVPSVLAYGHEAEPVSPRSFVDAYMKRVDLLLEKYGKK